MVYTRKNFRNIKIVGQTTDGKKVLSGLYKVCSSEGIDLFYILIELKKHNMVLDIIDFINSAVENGQNKYTLLEKIKFSYYDAYGSECSELITKVENYIKDYVP